MSQFNFKDKVVVITGAGRGLGRAYALAFAERGAKILVNDFGGSVDGKGRASSVADGVVAEINNKFGKGRAVANYNSVEDGTKVIQHAIDSFGHVDVLLNNAGILRDASFSKMTDDDWDSVYKVHLFGAFACTKAVWNHMKERKCGKIIMISSAAGIYGNYGQANYSAMKLALHGLCKTLSIEGKKYNIQINTVAPLAYSRILGTVGSNAIMKALKPEYISPLILYLCHESVKETGSLFEIGGGFISKLRWQRTLGANIPISQLSVESIHEKWNEICDFTKVSHPSTITESMIPIFSQISKLKKSNDKNNSNDPKIKSKL